MKRYLPKLLTNYTPVLKPKPAPDIATITDDPTVEIEISQALIPYVLGLLEIYRWSDRFRGDPVIVENAVGLFQDFRVALTEGNVRHIHNEPPSTQYNTITAPSGYRGLYIIQQGGEYPLVVAQDGDTGRGALIAMNSAINTEPLLILDRAVANGDLLAVKPGAGAVYTAINRHGQITMRYYQNSLPTADQYTIGSLALLINSAAPTTYPDGAYIGMQSGLVYFWARFKGEAGTNGTNGADGTNIADAQGLAVSPGGLAYASLITHPTIADAKRLMIGIPGGAPGADGTNIADAQGLAVAPGGLAYASLITHPTIADAKRLMIGIPGGAPGADGTNIADAQGLAVVPGGLAYASLISHPTIADAKRLMIGIPGGAPGADGTNIADAQGLAVSPGGLAYASLITHPTIADAKRLMIGIPGGAPGADGTNIADAQGLAVAPGGLAYASLITHPTIANAKRLMIGIPGGAPGADGTFTLDDQLPAAGATKHYSYLVESQGTALPFRLPKFSTISNFASKGFWGNNDNQGSGSRQPRTLCNHTGINYGQTERQNYLQVCNRPYLGASTPQLFSVFAYDQQPAYNQYDEYEIWFDQHQLSSLSYGQGSLWVEFDITRGATTIHMTYDFGMTGPSSANIGDEFDIVCGPYGGAYNGRVTFDKCCVLQLVSISGWTQGPYGADWDYTLCSGQYSGAQHGQPTVPSVGIRVYGFNSSTQVNMRLKVISAT